MSMMLITVTMEILEMVVLETMGKGKWEVAE
jgi:hypothetical protein